MTTPLPIGGYFELDLPRGDFPHSDAILLNTGRACIEYILRANDVRHVYVPKFTCDVVVEPLDKLGVPWSFYAIDDAFEIASPMTLSEGDYLIANNYFGVKDAYCRALAERYGRRLILDSSQAFFAEPPAGAQSFYTPRKYFGVADGGCLVTDRRIEVELETDRSHARSSHLTKRIDCGAEAAFADFQRNDASLKGEPMKWMSPLTKRLLGAIDYEDAARRRRDNFAYLADALGGRNRFAPTADAACPMVYPFLTDRSELRARLIAEKIFVATYWPNMFTWSAPGEVEHDLATNLLPLPIDQRYGIDEMKRIVSVLA